MTYQSAPPPYGSPPPGPPGPVMAGPGGAYGPINPTGPMPGTAPMPQIERPGSIKGIQIILWIMAVLSAAGELLSIISLVNYFHPVGLISVVLAAFFLVKSILAPVYIGRGRRWAWVLALIGSILGTLGGVGMLISGIVLIDEAPWILLVAVAYLGLYCTLLVLLCTSSARMWMTSQRMLQMVEKNPALAQAATPAPAQPGGTDQQALVSALQTLMQGNPNKKPGSLITGHVFMWLLAATSTALFVFMVYGIREPFFREFLPEEFPLYFPMVGMSSALMLLTLALSVGLAYRARWAGMGSLIGSIIATLLIITIFVCNLITQDGRGNFYAYIEPALLVQLWLCLLGMALAITATILLSIPSGRRWLARMNEFDAAPSGPNPAHPPRSGPPPPAPAY